jgi:uncharacterized protein (TIGR00661 family)
MKKIKILYGIQCTGNGHLTRSKEIIKFLEENYSDSIDRIDVCLSGNFSQIDKSELNVRWEFEGLGFDLKDGKISIINTIKNAKIRELIKSILKLDLSEYDIIISDFEPITCWAGIINRRKVLGVGNHFKFLSNNKFLKNLSPYYFSNKIITKLFSPVHSYLSFNYLKENENEFFPIIRKSFRKINLQKEEYYLIYLSSFSVEDQIKFFSLFPKNKFYIYHNKINEAYDFENLKLRPIDKLQFTEKLIKCKGVICHTGFQLTSECLFLGKKLLVMPIKNQIEQIYNTKELNKFGVLSTDKLEVPIFDDFLENDYSVKLNFIDEMDTISQKILSYRS